MAIDVRVVRGAEWLDATYPGWERKIDLGALMMSSACRCILGQIVGTVQSLRSFEMLDGFNAVVVVCDTAWLRALGFSLDFTSVSREWKELDEAWLALLKERFDTGNLSDL